MNSPSVQFATLDAEIRKALGEVALRWFYIGSRLIKIKEGHLYRDKFASWKDYCESTGDFGRRRADQLIQDAEERIALSELLEKSGSQLPLSASSVPHMEQKAVSELGKIEDPKEKLDVFLEAVESTEGKPTAKAVQRVREKRANATVIDAATGKPEVEDTRVTVKLAFEPYDWVRIVGALHSSELIDLGAVVRGNVERAGIVVP